MFRKVCSKHRYLGLFVLFCFYTDWGGVGLGRGMGRNSFPFRVDPFSRFLTRVASFKVFQFPLKKKRSCDICAGNQITRLECFVLRIKTFFMSRISLNLKMEFEMYC